MECERETVGLSEKGRGRWMRLRLFLLPFGSAIFSILRTGWESRSGTHVLVQERNRWGLTALRRLVEKVCTTPLLSGKDFVRFSGQVWRACLYISRNGLLVDEALLIKEFEFQKDFFVSNVFSLKIQWNRVFFKKISMVGENCVTACAQKLRDGRDQKSHNGRHLAPQPVAGCWKAVYLADKKPQQQRAFLRSWCYTKAAERHESGKRYFETPKACRQAWYSCRRWRHF